MRVLIGIFTFFFLSSDAFAETFVFNLQAGSTVGSWQIDFTGDGTDPTISYIMSVGVSGGPFISGPDTTNDPANFSQATLFVSVTGTNGYYQSTSTTCSEFDFHCSRADRTQGGFFSDISQVLDVSVSEGGSGPYAFSGPLTLYIGIPVGEAFVVGVPEPSTWAMLLIGFAGIGFAAFRKRRLQYAFVPLEVI
jgi:hypothetical protein